MTKKSTDAVFKEGWLCTGDLGFFDTNNILYIVGRKKEVIIVNGQNYHPFDLEDSIIKKIHWGNRKICIDFLLFNENRKRSSIAFLYTV